MLGADDLTRRSSFSRPTIWSRVSSRGAPTTSSQAGSWSTAMSGTMRSGVRRVWPLVDWYLVPGRTK